VKRKPTPKAKRRAPATGGRAIEPPAGKPAGRAAKSPTGELQARAPKPATGEPAGAPPEIPDSELPPLTFPNSEEYQFRQLADARRRVRIRNEGIFGGILMVGGLVFLAVAHNPAFLVVALIGAAALVAYEMTVATLE
jgi:hypothetical protein